MAVSFVNTQYYNVPKVNFYAGNRVNFGDNILSRVRYPDFKQYNLPNVGEYYCGPVSAANIIAMFAKKGFVNLYPTNNPIALIKELAKNFQTNNHGTRTDGIILGLKSFVESKGYKADIKYQGFRDIDPSVKSANIPDLNWIMAEMKKGNAILLNIGIYDKSMQNGKPVYTRQYGHFVTAVGAGTDGLSGNPNYLTIHDPYDRVKGDHYIKVKQIPEGKLIHNAGDDEIALTDNAAGFLEAA